jgi:hypothetical protein
MWRCWSGALACRSSRRRSAESQISSARSGLESLLTHGEWRSLVAHPAGGRAVAGSNPVSPTQGSALGAPGTGTPEAGGLTSRELLAVLRSLAGEVQVAAADVVEVSPPYDLAGATAIAAANAAYDLVGPLVMSGRTSGAARSASRSARA